MIGFQADRLTRRVIDLPRKVCWELKRTYAILRDHIEMERMRHRNGEQMRPTSGFEVKESDRTTTMLSASICGSDRDRLGQIECAEDAWTVPPTTVSERWAGVEWVRPVRLKHAEVATSAEDGFQHA